MNPKVTVFNGDQKVEATMKIKVQPTTEVEGRAVLYFCRPVDLRGTIEIQRVSKGGTCFYTAELLGKPKNHHAEVLLRLKN